MLGVREEVNDIKGDNAVRICDVFMERCCAQLRRSKSWGYEDVECYVGDVRMYK